MTDPVRWLEAPDAATETERSLVRAGQAWQMPTREKQAVWGQILTVLPATTAPEPQAAGPSPIGSSIGPMSVLRIGKILSAVVVATGVSILGYRVTRPEAPTNPSAPIASSNALPTIASPVYSAVVSTREPMVTNGLAPAVATLQTAHPVATSLPRESQLELESQALLEARRALRSNEPAKALRLLEQAQVRFKPGMLSEERAALTIQALARSGSREAAATRAQSFLKTYPKSPHAVDVQQYLVP